MNSFAEFLRANREKKGPSNISAFYRRYRLPITENYYRDLEAGRRIISIDLASELCRALEVDECVFYASLLKDLLPSDVQELLLPSRDSQIIDNSFSEEELSLDPEAIDFFQHNKEYMPVLTFIYLQDQSGLPVSLVEEFGRCLNIQADYGELMLQLEKLHLVSLHRAGDGVTKVIKRARCFKWNDPELEHHCIYSEWTNNFNKAPLAIPLEDNGQFGYYSFHPLDSKEYDQIIKKIEILVASFASEASQSGAETEVFSYNAIVSRCPEFVARSDN